MKIKLLKLLWICLLPVLIISCTTVHRKKTEFFYFDQFNPESSFIISKISADRKAGYNGTEELLPHLITGLGVKYGINIIEKAQVQNSKILYLDIYIRENSFVKELNELNSVTIWISIKDSESGNKLAEVMYTEDSARSITSFYQLYKITEAAVKKLAHELHSLKK